MEGMLEMYTEDERPATLHILSGPPANIDVTVELTEEHTAQVAQACSNTHARHMRATKRMAEAVRGALVLAACTSKDNRGCRHRRTEDSAAVVRWSGGSRRRNAFRVCNPQWPIL